MIENRARIEKQILLGRQSVRQSYRGRTVAESRSLTEQNKHEQREANVAAIAAISTTSGFEAPLSADTDAEAAFARRSPFKRRHSSKQLLSNRAGDPSAVDSLRRRSRFTESPTSLEGIEHDPTNFPSSIKVSNPEHQSSSFFSKFGAKSLSKLSLPFSYDWRTAVNQPAEIHQSHSFTSSSGSSSEPCYTWNMDDDPDK
jgi:hypothetical protein